MSIKKNIIKDYCASIPLKEMVAKYQLDEESIKKIVFASPYRSQSYERCREGVALRREGKSLQEISDMWGVTRERVRQILDKHAPFLKHETIGPALISANKLKVKQEEFKARWGRDSYLFEDDVKKAMSAAFTRKRENSKRSKWGWELERTDITYPLTCPILGIELDWMAGSRQENSPSFDRLDSSKGYVKGNVIICSWRANRIKNDGSSKEHLQIADFLSNLGL